MTSKDMTQLDTRTSVGGEHPCLSLGCNTAAVQISPGPQAGASLLPSPTILDGGNIEETAQ